MLDLFFLKAGNELKSISKKINLKDLIACQAFKTQSEASKAINEFKLQGIKAIPCNLIEGRQGLMKNLLNAFNAKNISEAMQAVSRKGINLLLLRDAKAIDAGMIALASRNNVAIGLLLADFLKQPASEQALLLRQWAFIARLCRKFQTNFFVFSGAVDLTGLRNPEDLKALYSLLGFSKDQANRFSNQAVEILSQAIE